MPFRGKLCAVAVAILSAVASEPTWAFDITTITIKVGYGAGGTYDLSSRLVARHLPRFLPGNPSVVVQNVPGGGSLKLTMLMLGSEPADGSVIASVSSAMAYATKLDPENATFDPLLIQWIGALSKEPAFCAMTKASGVDTVEKFIKEEFLLGASGRASQTYQLAAVVKNALSAKFRIVTGFEGVAEIELAMYRGEIAGHCAVTAIDLTKKPIAAELNVIGRLGAVAPAGFEAVPRFIDQINDPVVRAAAELIESTRDVNYPLIAPPGIPQDVLEAYRTAFDAMVKDPEFIAEAEELGEFSLDPTPGAEVMAIVTNKYTSDSAVFEAARNLMK